jgi:hypothetical protein
MVLLETKTDCKGWDNRIAQKQQQKHTQINKIKK